MITVVASLKGGSGKSTMTFNLAVWLAMAGANVRVHDLDPQGTLTDVSEVRDEEGYEPAIKVYHGFRGMKAASDSHDDTNTEVLVDIGLADYAAVKKALAVAERIVIPVTPSQADVWSTQRFLKLIDELYGKEPKPPVQAFINRGDTHHAVRETDEAAAALIALPGVSFIRKRLHQRTIYRRSFSEGLAVFEMEPRSKAASEFTALAAALYPERTN